MRWRSKREEIERLAKDRDDEQAILDRNIYPLRLADQGKKQSEGPKGFKEVTKSTMRCWKTTPRPVVADRSSNEKLQRVEALQQQYEAQKRDAGSAASRTRSRSAAGRRPAAGCDEDGQGLCRREAQASAG